MTIRALCVGINKYQNHPDDTLQECVADAKTMQHIFEGLGCKDLVYLYDAMAVKRTIAEALKAIVDASKPGDVLFWSHSSHGTTYADKSGMTHEALCCHDIAEKDGDWDFSTLLTGPEVGKILAGMPKGSHAELWWDACYSGLGLRRMKLDTKSHPHIVGGDQRPKFLAPIGHPIGINSLAPDRQLINDIPCEVILWAACSGNETAADAPNLGNGAFTYYWKKNYLANPKRTRTDIIAYTRMALRKAGFSQNPHLECDSKPAFERVGK